jgi:hypothetical protein
MQEFFTKYNLLNIPEYLCPMFVLSDNLRSLISAGIKKHEKGSYNHAMWYLGNGIIASQNLLFQTEHIRNYWNKCRMKFWYCPLWSGEERRILKAKILADTQKPWYRRIYDPVAILGQLVHLDWLQIPGLDICSDKGRYLGEFDPTYNLKNPDPEDINKWLETNPRYKVYCRYAPD